ncbi:MAG: NAD-dependent epimerase/dehydratase family protein [Pirellulaceae bacterium]|nr:NAD-dependent epimerase/dehydratase family protein [Pirellulaceae bacterium]
MRILVTGATGFLGNNVVRALLAEKHEVAVALRQSSNRKALDGLNVEFITVDLNSPNDVAMALAGCDCVVHSAALIQLGWTKLAESRKTNVEATATIAQAARRKNIRMVHVSSVDALGVSSQDRPGTEEELNPPNPPCSYVVSKREAETAVIVEVANGLDAVIVNPGFMIGPYDWKPSSGVMMLTVAKSLIHFAPAGGCSVVDVRDVADGIISAIKHGQTGERYILGGRNLTYFDFWTMIAKVTNTRAPKKVLPDWIAKTAGRAGDVWTRLSGNEPDINSAATQMGQMFHFYNSDKAEKYLGYQIGNIEDALKDAWDWFILHGYAKK